MRNQVAGRLPKGLMHFPLLVTAQGAFDINNL
jgi:hypothetical protein